MNGHLFLRRRVSRRVTQVCSPNRIHRTQLKIRELMDLLLEKWLRRENGKSEPRCFLTAILLSIFDQDKIRDFPGPAPLEELLASFDWTGLSIDHVWQMSAWVDTSKEYVGMNHVNNLDLTLYIIRRRSFR